MFFSSQTAHRSGGYRLLQTASISAWLFLVTGRFVSISSFRIAKDRHPYRPPSAFWTIGINAERLLLRSIRNRLIDCDIRKDRRSRLPLASRPALRICHRRSLSLTAVRGK
jgi:hypothetical protein